MLEILDDFCQGRADIKDIDSLEQLGKNIKTASLCGLGQTAANPVLSTLRYFKEEYLAHIRDNICPAGVCKELISYTIDTDLCTGCLLCKKRCPEGAISGELKEVHSINQDQCSKCGICREICNYDAVLVT